MPRTGNVSPKPAELHAREKYFQIQINKIFKIQIEIEVNYMKN